MQGKCNNNLIEAAILVIESVSEMLARIRILGFRVEFFFVEMSLLIYLLRDNILGRGGICYVRFSLTE